MTTETFTPDALPFAASKEEYEEMQNGELTDQAIISELLSRFNLDFYWNGEKLYNPKDNASYKKYKLCNEFTVHYSFPYNADSPVASFWLYKEGTGRSPYQFVHIDVHKIMTRIVDHYKAQGFTRPPARN